MSTNSTIIEFILPTTKNRISYQLTYLQRPVVVLKLIFGLDSDSTGPGLGVDLGLIKLVFTTALILTILSLECF